MVRVRELHPATGAAEIEAGRWAQKLPISDSGRDEVLRACEMVRQAGERVGNPTFAWTTEADCYAIGLEMADILGELHMDQPALLAAVLYRAVREEKLPLGTVRDAFGDEVADLGFVE